MKRLGLYLHIPFCRSKCLYCDFCSFPKYSEEGIKAYVSALCCEIKRYGERADGYSADTVYFGGGTPTLLPISEFERIFTQLRDSFSISPDAEITCECNPATADSEYFSALRRLGVNRLSIGLQSVDESELRALGRIHSYRDFVDTYNRARRVGFDNISADLMYGIPKQTIESFGISLDKLIELSPEHISVYGLKVEAETPFGRMRDKLILPDEDSECEMYMLCSNRLYGAGYEKYEISNFARHGYESRHNLKYWTGGEYIGFGIAAHSYFCGERFANSRDIDGYLVGENVESERKKISHSEQMTEYVMLRMRLSRGVELLDFAERFGKDFDELYRDKLLKYERGGYVKREHGSVSFTDKGFLVSNFILSDILEFE